MPTLINDRDLFSAIERTIRSVVNNQGLAVKPESTLAGDLGLESIDFLDVSSELENTLGWELNFRDVAEFKQGKSEHVDLKRIRVQDIIDFAGSRKVAA